MKRNDIFLPAQFLKELKIKLAEHQVMTDPADCWLYSYDNGRHRGQPQGVIFPESHEEVSHIVKTCYMHHVPIVARGRGTGTPGGSIPTQGGVVLSFEKMDKIIYFDKENKIIKTQTGCLNKTIQKYAEKAGFFWAPDPGSSDFCTIGGNIAYNAGGPRGVKYGTTREHVLGLTAIIGNGDTIQTGSLTTKGAVGYDLTRLLIGSEGTLAVITEAILKLTPLPSFKNTVRALYKDADHLTQAVISIMSQAHLPSALEFLDHTCVKLTQLDDNKYPHACLLLINIDDENAKCSIITSLHNPGLINIDFAENESDIQNLWLSRKQLSQSLRKISPKKISEDIVVPVSKTSALLQQINTLNKKYSIPIVTFGHIGNGNLHVNLLIEETTPQHNIQNCLKDLFQMVLNLEGTLSGEHGIGIEKKPFITQAIDAPTLAVMKNIKKVFDPNNILNPGKIF